MSCSARKVAASMNADWCEAVGCGIFSLLAADADRSPPREICSIYPTPLAWEEFCLSAYDWGCTPHQLFTALSVNCAPHCSADASSPTSTTFGGTRFAQTAGNPKFKGVDVDCFTSEKLGFVCVGRDGGTAALASGVHKMTQKQCLELEGSNDFREVQEDTPEAPTAPSNKDSAACKVKKQLNALQAEQRVLEAQLPVTKQTYQARGVGAAATAAVGDAWGEPFSQASYRVSPLRQSRLIADTPQSGARYLTKPQLTAAQRYRQAVRFDETGYKVADMVESAYQARNDAAWLLPQTAEAAAFSNEPQSAESGITLAEVLSTLSAQPENPDVAYVCCDPVADRCVLTTMTDPSMKKCVAYNSADTGALGLAQADCRKTCGGERCWSSRTCREILTAAERVDLEAVGGHCFTSKILCEDHKLQKDLLLSMGPPYE